MSLRTHYPPAFKHKVLCEYQPNTYGCGFEALAKKYSIKGSHHCIQRWYEQWDHTVESLHELPHTGRKRKLSHQQSKQLILTPVRQALRKKQKIDYNDIHTNITAIPEHSDISLRTVRRYGKQDHHITCKKTTLVVEQKGMHICVRLLILHFLLVEKHVICDL